MPVPVTIPLHMLATHTPLQSPGGGERGLLLGALFGLCFPILGTLVEAARRGALTLTGFWEVQADTPLLWIIDSAPFVLGIMGWLIALPYRSRADMRAERRPLWALLVLLAVLPALLLLFSIYEDNTVARSVASANQSGSLRYRSLLTFQLAQQNPPGNWKYELAEMGRIRQNLAGEHPESTRLTDDAWRDFSTSLERTERVDQETTLRMLRSADAMTNAIEQEAERRNRSAAIIQIIGVLALLVSLPLSFGVMYRRDQAEVALRESEERFDLAVRATNDGVFDRNLVTGRNYFSPRIKAMLGYTEQEWEASHSDVLALIHPEDREETMRKREDFYSGRSENSQLEFRLQHRDGSYIWVRTHALLVHDAATGKLIRAIGVYSDVTERRRQEEALRKSELRLNQAQQIARLGSWEYDTATERIFWSAEMFRLLQFDPARGEPDYATLATRYHPDDRPRHRAAFEKARQDGEPYELDNRAVLDDGSIRWMHSTCTSIRDESGKVMRLMGTVQDITERKADEERLNALTQELQRSNAALQDFAHVASHDLKEPLRKIQMFGGMLRRKAGDTLAPENRDYVDRMINAAGRMQTLVEGLLDYSRVSIRPAEPQNIALADVVAGVLSDLEARILDQRAAVEVEALPTVRADALQMRQLFQNLIANALKFRREDIPQRVRVTATRAGEFWELRVEDNGIGFEPEVADRIFGIFERLGGRHQAYEGSGVGLAICRQIAERNGGSITAEGTPGVGATFTVRLPAFTG